jgi:hypothetical protein
MGSGKDEVTKTAGAATVACVERDALRERPSKEARANTPSTAYLPLHIENGAYAPRF